MTDNKQTKLLLLVIVIKFGCFAFPCVIKIIYIVPLNIIICAVFSLQSLCVILC